jgi:nucleoside phosphorylase
MSAFDRRPSCLRVLAAFALVTAGACGGSDDHTTQSSSRIAVLSAFPAELAAVLEHATIDETTVVGGHIFRLGTIGDTPVVVAMTGIGLVNADATTNLLLDNFDVRGVVFSGVAGSAYRIGDVAVPQTWRAPDGSTYDCDRGWLARAKRIAKKNDLSFEQCTQLPNDPQHPTVCLDFDPVMTVGGIGESSDPPGSNGQAMACQPTSTSDVFACDVPGGSVPTTAAALQAHDEADAADTDEAIAQDEETAPVARLAAAHHLPFIAFRATSDGAGDPLNLPGFPAQFFAYYRLAAHNAAAGAAALVEQL